MCIVDAYLAFFYFNSDACIAGYLSSCYTFVFAELNASAARSNCQSMGGDLATIETHAENDVLFRSIRFSKFYFQI